jgi:hypothetical protein
VQILGLQLGEAVVLELDVQDARPEDADDGIDLARALHQ